MTLPQLVCSTLVRGTPFYDELARNAWLAMYAGPKSPEHWASAPQGITLLSVIREDPMAFALHWVREVQCFLASSTGWPTGFSILLVVATLAAAFSRRFEAWRRILFVGTPLAAIAATALAFFIPRHGLVPIVGLSAAFGSVAGLGYSWLAAFSSKRPRLRTALLLVACVAGVLLVTRSVHAYSRRPTIRFAAALHELVRDLGGSDIREVATNVDVLVDNDSAWLERYRDLGAQWWATSCAELLNLARSRGDDIRFVVLDHRAFWGDFKGVKREVDRGGSLLAPVFREDSLEVYMVRPGGIGDAEADSVEVLPGMLLLGHTWVWRGERLVVYLYWIATAPIAERYIVEVRLVGAEGQVLASHAGAPELGTYPTTRWEVGMVVVDAHVLDVPKVADQGDIEVCLSGQVEITRDCQALWPVKRNGRTTLP